MSRHSGVVDALPPASHVSGVVGVEALAAFDLMVLGVRLMRRDDDFKKNCGREPGRWHLNS